MDKAWRTVAAVVVATATVMAMAMATATAAAMAIIDTAVDCHRFPLSAVVDATVDR